MSALLTPAFQSDRSWLAGLRDLTFHPVDAAALAQAPHDADLRRSSSTGPFAAATSAALAGVPDGGSDRALEAM